MRQLARERRKCSVADRRVGHRAADESPGGEKRFPLRPDALSRESLVAEHGFAALVTVTSSSTSESLLFDAGLSRHRLMHNMDVLEIAPNALHTIVLSHGHADHTNGLMGLVERLGQRKMPLVLHPDASLERKLAFPDGYELKLPPRDRRVLSQEGIEFIEERGASCVLGGLVLVTGEIERTTALEQGFPIHYARVAGRWQHDALIHDDQAIVVNVRGKGLVILTGRGHAGAINTVRRAQKLTGVPNVYIARDMVLDTSVLVAATRSDRGTSGVLLVSALEQRYKLLVSVPLMIEYEAVLTRTEHLDVASCGEIGRVRERSRVTVMRLPITGATTQRRRAVARWGRSPEPSVPASS